MKGAGGVVVNAIRVLFRLALSPDFEGDAVAAAKFFQGPHLLARTLEFSIPKLAQLSSGLGADGVAGATEGSGGGYVEGEGE